MARWGPLQERQHDFERDVAVSSSGDDGASHPKQLDALSDLLIVGLSS
ncbi:hypothetical protein [Candidatus Viadribacter manganicus]|nr:hypothetical protein [Candidatus Viadribacter manganicus]